MKKNQADLARISIRMERMNAAGWWQVIRSATVTLTYGDNSILDPERVSAQLCQECFKKVADALWPTGFEKDWTYHCDVLMNMETEDIYPISSTITKCSIDDFWLHIDHEQENNRDIVYLVYNP